MPLKFYYIRLIRYYKKYGFLQSFRRMIEKMNQTRDEIVYYYDLILFNEHNLQNSQNITIESKTDEKQIGKDELNCLIEHIGKEIILTQLKERFAKGAVLWIIKFNGNLSGYVWSIGKSSTLNPYYFPLCDNDVFLFDGSVLPPYRGKNIYPQLLKNALYGVKQMGFSRAICDAYVWNIAVQKSFSKVGLKKFGIVRKYRLFGHDFILWKSKSPRP